MSDGTDQQQERPAAKRGEAAWKEARERVAARNDKARKAGKQERDAYERQLVERRREAEGRRTADLIRRRTP